VIFPVSVDLPKTAIQVLPEAEFVQGHFCNPPRRESGMEKSDPRVLLFEKDKSLAAAIERILRTEGCEVDTVNALPDVLLKTAEREFDVLVVGKSSGFEPETGALKGIDPNLRKILLTGRPEASDIFLFVNAGFDDYFAFARDAFGSFEAKNLILTVRGAGSRRERDFPSWKRAGKILVFSDASRTDSIRAFAEAGFEEVSQTGDLKRALRIIENNPLDFLVVDFTFSHAVPLLNALSVNRKPPVLLVSESDNDLPPESLFWCFDYFMIRPFGKREVLAAAEFLSQEEGCVRLPPVRVRRPDEAGVNFYLAGPYGAGKSTVARLLCDPGVIGSFQNSIPTLSPYPRYITRRLWPKEKEGVDYYFVEEAAFDELLMRGKEMDWERVDWGKKLEGIRVFYPLEGIRVSGDIPRPVGKDFLVAPAIRGFERMAPEDPRAHSIFFGISFETMKKRQLDRPESDRDKRTPKTLEEYKKYIALFDPYFPGRIVPGISDRKVNYGLMIMNESGNDPRPQQENDLNRMRKMAVRLAWYIKHVREGTITMNGKQD